MIIVYVYNLTKFFAQRQNLFLQFIAHVSNSPIVKMLRSKRKCAASLSIYDLGRIEISSDNIAVYYCIGKTINVCAMFAFLKSISFIDFFINVTSTHIALFTDY